MRVPRRPWRRRPGGGSSRRRPWRYRRAPQHPGRRPRGLRTGGGRRQAVGVLRPGGLRPAVGADPGVPGRSRGQLVEALRNGFSGANENSPRFLQPSAELSYAVDLRREGGARLDAASVRVAGEPVVADREYRVTVSEFLAEGGDGFTAFKDGTGRQGGDVTDTAALVTYLQNASSPEAPLAPPSPARIAVRQ
ncbi:5'-nucleotidase C-terminal domain-containing protein [Streptomyces sp. B5E4]|uniref:5'-nucleotidase C-terminal domain-containing protein n=1 Tax=Streptomyces sp. B5E4 TaxID=3153568 RepID=UPI00325F4257